jgi:adenylosuccinate lyase
MTTTFLMEAVKAGAGSRAGPHQVIKEHAVAVAEDLRSGKIDKNNLVERLAEDLRLKLSRSSLR